MRILAVAYILILLALPVMSGHSCAERPGCPFCAQTANAAGTSADARRESAVQSKRMVPGQHSCCSMENEEVSASTAPQPPQIARLKLAMERAGCHCLYQSGQPLPLPGREIAVPAASLSAGAVTPQPCDLMMSRTRTLLRPEACYDPPGRHLSISSTILRL